MVKSINSVEEYKKIIDSGKVVVIDCWATWCGPCKMISPVFEKLESQFEQIEFYKLDVDEQSEVAQEIGIKAMPTFVFFKNGDKLDSVVGANPAALQAALKKHSESS